MPPRCVNKLDALRTANRHRQTETGKPSIVRRPWKIHWWSTLHHFDIQRFGRSTIGRVKHQPVGGSDHTGTANHHHIKNSNHEKGFFNNSIFFWNGIPSFGRGKFTEIESKPRRRCRIEMVHRKFRMDKNNNRSNIQKKRTMKNEFIKRQTSASIWVSVNDCGTTFDVCKYGDTWLAESWRKCERVATDWLVDECNRQNRHQSFVECEFSASRLATLVGMVQHEFPLASDFAFVVDDFAESVGVLFGSIFVTESDFGFNIELIVNWLTKQRAVVCKNVSLDVAAGVVAGSESSRTFSDTDSRRLFFTNRNRKFLREVLQIN